MKQYKHTIFDIEGTLLYTEEAILKSLQGTFFDMLCKDVPIKELVFVLGIPGETALHALGIATSKDRNEYATDFLLFGIGDYFNVTICV